MASLDSKKIAAALLRKGFRVADSSHKFYWLYDGEKKTSVHTMISHGRKDYSDSLLAKMKKQLGLDTKAQLLELVQCPLSREDYLALLLAKGRVIRD